MQSKAKTVTEYLEELPDDRREQISAVRETILENLPAGYIETMNWGMISYEVPLSVYPDTYNKKPLLYAALASQKNHMAVYLNGIYCDKTLKERFEKDYLATDKKLDMGKCCVRFKKLENLPLEVVGQAIAALPMADYVQFSKQSQKNNKNLTSSNATFLSLFTS